MFVVGVARDSHQAGAHDETSTPPEDGCGVVWCEELRESCCDCLDGMCCCGWTPRRHVRGMGGMDGDRGWMDGGWHRPAAYSHHRHPQPAYPTPTSVYTSRSSQRPFPPPPPPPLLVSPRCPITRNPRRRSRSTITAPMSRQDKATTDRNARELRELVKQSDNKMCADCRKNDARWASWNLGVFVCIRCSGIHRSMGTHISKVKSIDLDIWQPEQLANVKKWGNRRANLYWERHLKAGHIPPDHKIESFIRSKYESRRWALEGPVPLDPSVLDGEDGGHAPPPVPTDSRPTPTTSAPPPRPSTSGHAPTRVAHPLLSTASARKPTPQIDLLNADFGEVQQPTKTTSAAPPAPSTAPAKQPPTLAPVVATTQHAPPAPSAGLFDLDFKPPSHTKPSAPTTKKSDIMSLFSSTSATNSMISQPLHSPVVQSHNPYASWSGGGTETSAAVQQHRLRVPSLSGGMAAMNFGGMGGNVWATPAAAAPAAPQQSNAFATQHSQMTSPIAHSQAYGNNTNNNHFLSTQDVWGSSGATSVAPEISPPNVQKQVNDPFANIWK